MLVHVAGDAEVRQVAHLLRRGDGAAEDENGHGAPPVELADRAHEVDAGRLGQVQAEDYEVRLAVADPAQQGPPPRSMATAR